MKPATLDLALFARLLARATPAPWSNVPDFAPQRTTEMAILAEVGAEFEPLMAVEHQPDGDLVVFLRNHAAALRTLAGGHTVLVAALGAIAKLECNGPGHTSWQASAARACPRCIARGALVSLASKP